MRLPAAGGQKAAVTCCHSAAVKASLWETGGERCETNTLTWASTRSKTSQNCWGFLFFFKWFLKMIEFQTCVLESRHAMRPFLEETKVHPGLKTRFWLKGKWLHSYVGMQIGFSCQIHKSQWNILSCFLSFANWSSLQIQTFFFFF